MLLFEGKFSFLPITPSFQYANIQNINFIRIKISLREILPRHTFAFHSTALDAIVHAELSPGHKEK